MGKNTEENRKKYDLERVQANSLNPLVVQSDEITARREAFEEKRRAGKLSPIEKMEEIIARIEEEGLSLVQASKGIYNRKRVYELLDENEELRNNYARACEWRADKYFDAIEEVAMNDIGDDTAFVGINRIHRAKLIVDTLKWKVSKMNPKKYGDKLDLGLTTDEPITIVMNLGLNKANEASE